MTQLLVQLCTIVMVIGPIWGFALGWWFRGWVMRYRIVRRDQDEPTELGVKHAGKVRP